MKKEDLTASGSRVLQGRMGGDCLIRLARIVADMLANSVCPRPEGVGRAWRPGVRLSFFRLPVAQPIVTRDRASRADPASIRRGGGAKPRIVSFETTRTWMGFSCLHASLLSG